MRLRSFAKDQVVVPAVTLTLMEQYSWLRRFSSIMCVSWVAIEKGDKEREWKRKRRQ